MLTFHGEKVCEDGDKKMLRDVLILAVMGLSLVGTADGLPETLRETVRDAMKIGEFAADLIIERFVKEG